MSEPKHSLHKIKHELKFRYVEGSSILKLTPSIVEITFTGEDLKGFTSAAFDNHVKIFFPHPGEDRPVAPTVGATGLIFPEGVRKPAFRDYTPRRYDPVTNELKIEILLHGDGPGSTWATQAKPGHIVGIGGPKGSLILSEDFDWYLLVGDETALPAISRRLEEITPGSKVIAVIEVENQQEERHFETAADLTLTWVYRNQGRETLLDAVRQSDFPSGDCYAWAAGETDAIRAVRKHLIEDRGLAKEWMKTAGYWKKGTAGTHDKHGD